MYVLLISEILILKSTTKSNINIGGINLVMKNVKSIMYDYNIILNSDLRLYIVYMHKWQVCIALLAELT